MPTTTDELYQVLKAFKTGDPNGNGRADEIPASSWAWNDFSLVDLFCAFIKDYSGEFSVSNGKVWHFITQDGFTDAMAWFNRLYAEGLLDQEMFTQDRAIFEAKIVPPQGSPAIVGLGASFEKADLGRDRFDQYATLLPVKGPKGYSGIRYVPNNYQIRKFSGVLSGSCKYPEIAMRWIDTLYEMETSAKIVLDPDFVPLDAFDRYEDYSEKEGVLKPYATYQDYFSTVIPFSVEESLELATVWTDLNLLIQQQVAQWVTQGSADLSDRLRPV
jgi:ABC-type glycerol-3-phosphate transport system substrate-binding protein